MKKSLLSLAVITALSSTALMASDVRVSGFTSIVAGQNFDDKKIGNYDGYDDGEIRFQPDSVVGLQITGKITDDMSATAQLIGRFDSTDGAQNADADIAVEWAYINYAVTDELTVQAGRFRPAVYLYSNTQDVGYSYLWVKPPSEFYGQVPMTYGDGINLMLGYTFDNDMSLNASLYYTSTKEDVSGYAFDFTKLYGAEVTLGNDYFKVRAGYAGTTMDANIGLASGTPAYIRSALEPSNTDASFISAGLSVDYMDIIFIGEYAQRNIKDTVFPEDTTEYYATLGYRIGDFTPNITYSSLDSTVKKITGNDGAGGAYNSIVNAAREGTTTANDINAITFGVRYDVNPMAALKVEYKTIDKTPVLTNVKSSGALGRVSLDIVF